MNRCLILLVLAGACTVHPDQRSAQYRQPSESGEAQPVDVATPRLRVSDNGRYLERDGLPFFWLGDTAWILFQATTREEADMYLQTRARQGFTVVQAAIVMGEEQSGVAGTLRANVYGDQAFIGGNPARPALTDGNNFSNSPEYDYWDHVDYIVERASAHGLTLGLLPLFIGYNGPAYRYLTPERSYQYGLFLGQRYRTASHVFWILGGDNTPETAAAQRVWHDLARGITVGAGGSEDYDLTLMTYHINGDFSSSLWFHDSPWLDFNMIQVWGKEPQIYRTVLNDYQRTPPKPTGLGEGSYEDGPQYPAQPIDGLKIRQQAYWSYFAGGYHTYGNNNVWHFGSYQRAVTDDWRRALDSDGVGHLSMLARFLNALPWWTLEPAPSMLASVTAEAEGTVALRSASGDLALVYLPGPATVSVSLETLRPGGAIATWVDPRTGEGTAIRRVSGASASFSSPRDWVDALLLLDARSVPPRR